MDLRCDAIYARQSIDKEGSLSIQGQIDQCKVRCDTAKVLEFPEGGKSGKDTDRPKLQELLKAIEKGKVKRVIVYKLDPLHVVSTPACKNTKPTSHKPLLTVVSPCSPLFLQQSVLPSCA